MSKKSIRFFNDREVRAVWDDENNKWWFSATDIVRAINNEDDYVKAGNYWRWLKKKLNTEGVQLVSATHDFKFQAPDGKQRAADALDAEPPEGCGMFAANKFKRIGEVKSYYPTKHLVCANTPADQLEERWQIAVAMAVCETIEEGRLLFYNPSMPEDMLYVVEYDRTDLADEIDIVLDVEDKWLTFVENYKVRVPAYVDGLLEQEIIRDIMRREELNPESEKSVIR